MRIVYTLVLIALSAVTATAQTPGSLMNLQKEPGFKAASTQSTEAWLGLSYTHSLNNADFDIKALGLLNLIEVGTVSFLGKNWIFTVPVYGSLSGLAESDLSEKGVSERLREIASSSQGIVAEIYPLALKSTLSENFTVRLHGGSCFQFHTKRDTTANKDVSLSRGILKVGIDITVPGATIGSVPPSLSLYFNHSVVMSKAAYTHIYSSAPATAASWYRFESSVPIVDNATVLLIKGEFSSKSTPVWSLGLGVIGGI